MKKQSLLRAALLAGLSTLALSAFGAPATEKDGVLVGPNGMTLYTFDKDEANSGKSMCNGPCLANWPALMATESDKPEGSFTIITRDDGKKQWAVKGKPLYYWVKDTKPGDRTGDGFNKVWSVAKP